MATVYLVQRPRENKFGWTPDLTDATRYGSMKVIFEPNEKPQFLTGPSMAAEVSPIINVLRWERNIEQGDRDRRAGWYMPTTLEFRKEIKHD